TCAPRWRWCSACPRQVQRRPVRWKSIRWRPRSTRSSSPQDSAFRTARACTSAPFASRRGASPCAGRRRAETSSESRPISRAITLDPTSAEALEALEALTADSGDFDRLADVLERKLEVAARGPREQKAILARLGELYSRNLSRPPQARRAYERLLKIDPGHA